MAKKTPLPPPPIAEAEGNFQGKDKWLVQKQTTSAKKPKEAEGNFYGNKEPMGSGKNPRFK
jgi:hypothetical protein